MTWKILLAVSCSVWAQPAPEAPAECHYAYTVWNVKARKSLIRKTIRKPYAELTAREKDPSGCTPCQEDQAEFVLANGLKFTACRKVGGVFQQALNEALARGQKVASVMGYRVQVSKGPVDPAGNRTELSNHSFGTAVDVNEEHNGLYENCLEWSARCRLRKGGRYRPGEDPLALTGDSPAVAAFKKAGYAWGGRIAGRQKDFMHFSATGY